MPRTKALPSRDQFLHPREDQPEADQDEDDQSGPAEEALGQPERGQQQGTGKGDQRETQYQPGDDLHRPPVLKSVRAKSGRASAAPSISGRGCGDRG